LTNNELLIQDALSQIEDGSALLTRGIGTQQEIDELLAEIDAALAKADEAVSLGEKTLKEAQNTLETLRGIFLKKIFISNSSDSTKAVK